MIKHQWAKLASEINYIDDNHIWKWCIKCGKLKLGKEIFCFGRHQNKILRSLNESIDQWSVIWHDLKKEDGAHFASESKAKKWIKQTFYKEDLPNFKIIKSTIKMSEIHTDYCSGN